MNFVEIIVNHCLYLLCPIALYLLYMMYRKNADQEESTLTLEIALISSLYFLLRYGMTYEQTYPTMLFDIPLLICYFKKKTGFGIVISLVLIIYQSLFMQVHPFLLGIEYGLYFGIYYYLLKKKISTTPIQMVNCFIVIKSFILSLEVFWFIHPNGGVEENITYLLSIIFVLYFIANLLLYFFDQGEKIVDLNTSLYKIEREKELRTSLFKVTHEIKNPIAVCKGYLDMLDLNDKKKVFKYVPIVKDEINRTLTLMDDFLDYTKIKIEKEEIDLTMLLEETEQTLASLFFERGVRAYFRIPEEEIYVEADYNRLKQVLINVLKNAVEAKDEEKIEPWIIVEISFDRGKKEVEIMVTDNGVGMNQETLEKATDMFFTTKAKGTGLGISLSKEIMELHQGSIVYDSKEGAFTKVRLTLPQTLDVA